MPMPEADLRDVQTKLHRVQKRWEPWQALSAAFGAGVAFASAFIAASVWVLMHIAK